MLAVGPVAILPSPLLAALPTYNSGTNSGSFTATNGSVTLATSGASATISTTDRSVLVWSSGAFNIATGETFNFAVPGGSVLNKVGYTTNGADLATINGTLTSSGRVFVLSNGGILVGANATINTQSGLFLSTLAEANDFTYTTQGNLSFSGTSQGTITIGTGSLPVQVTNGALGAWAGTVTLNNVTVAGDAIINSGAGANLAGVGGPTSVGGSLTVVTSNSSVTQSRALSVGGITSLTTGTGSSTLDYQGVSTLSITAAGTGFTAAPTVTISGGGGSGATAVATATTSGVTTLTITNPGSGYTGTPTVTISGAGGTGATAALSTKVLNDFATVQAITGGSVTLLDANNLGLGASTIGGSLFATASGNVLTTGAVAVNNTVSLTSTSVGDISFANGSSATTTGGTLTANAVSGNIVISTVGNLSTGSLTTGGVALNAVNLGGAGTGYTANPTVTLTGGGGSGASATAVVSGGVVTSVGVTGGSGYTSAPTVSFSGGGILPGSASTSNATITGTTLNYTVGTFVPVTVAQFGTGFDVNNLPTVAVSGGGGTGATVVPVWVNGVLTGVNITAVGTGFTAAPTLSLTGGNPTPVVAATAPGTFQLALVGTTLASVGLPGSGGTGYTAAPSVSITGGGGTGATATATLGTSGAVTGYVISTAGTGYTGSPTITLTGGGINPTSAASASVATAGSGGNVTVSTTGNLTVASSITAGNVSVTAPSITTTGGTISTNGALTYNATGGNLVVGNANARTFSINDAGGNITQIGALAHIANVSSTTPIITINASSAGNVTLTNSNSLTGIFQIVGKDVAITTNKNITIGTTNTSGNLTLNTSNGNSTSGTVNLGTFNGTAAQGMIVGNNFAVTTNAAAVQDDNFSTQFIFGTTTINTVAGNATGANVVFNAAAASPNGATGRFGQLNANTGSGTLTYSENTAINVGNVTGAGGTIRSVNSDIIINGNVIMSGATTFNASSGAITEGATGVVNLASTSTFNSSNSFGTNLSNTTNVFGGNVTVINGLNNIIVSGSSIGFNGGNVTAGNLSVTTVNAGTNVQVNGGNTTNVTITSAGRAIINGGTHRNLTITANDTSSTSITQSSGFTLNGTLTLTSLGNVTIGSLAGSTANITGNVVLANVVGDTNVHSVRNLTISGNTTGNLFASAGAGNLVATSFANPWNLFLGNLNARSLLATAWNGVIISSLPDVNSGQSGNITQLAGSSIHIENQADFATFLGNIAVTNNGNSAGRVNLATGGNTSLPGTSGSIAYTEDATAKLGFVATNTTATITSRFGSIIEDSTSNVVINSGGLLTLAAPSGSIQLGNTTHTAGTTTGNFTAVGATATGAIQLLSTGNVVLSPTASNSLAVTGNTITQSGPLNIFGLASFTAVNGITLTDSANNFGPVSVNITGINKNVAIVESNTLNFRQVVMPSGGNGTITATSLNGDIIDTGLAGAKFGGNATGTGSGIVTLSATNGNITIDDPTSDFLSASGVVFNAKNVTLSILGSNTTALILGAAGVSSTATGNLIASTALGSVANAGAFSVGGNAFFQATNGTININQPGVGFGTLKFIGQIVNIAEAGNTDILTGSQAFGAAFITSGGNINIDSSGGGVVSFGSTAGFQAAGNITLKSVQAVNTITVTATGTKDLSALSLSSDLNSKTPVDAGTGPGPSTVPALAPKP